jgi:regulatory protein
MKKEIALNKCMAMCSKSEYCIFDIRQKLIRWEVEEPDAVIDQLIEDRFLDEERYVPAFVRDKFRFNRWGKIKIAHHLRQKQIPDYLIKKSMAEIKEGEYYEAGIALLQSKLKSVKYKDHYDLKNKLVRFMAGRGFEPSLVYQWVDEVNERNI